MTRAALHTACPGLKDTVWEGAEAIPIAVTMLRLAGRDVGMIEWSQSEERFERLLISHATVRTDKANGVGSTVGELRQRLGNLQAGYDDAGVYVWSTTETHLSYLLRFQVTSVLRTPDDIGARADVIPDSALVRAVIFTRQR